jgi:voltage-gated potassium channel
MSAQPPEGREQLNPWDWMVLVVACLSLALILLETFLTLSPETLRGLLLVDHVACGIFLVDILVRWRRQGWGARYWRWGWLDVLASLPLDPAFRVFQAARIYRVIRVIRALRRLQVVTDGTSLNEKLLALPGIASLLVIFCVNLVLEVEQNAQGSHIRDHGDALWWTLSTVTTVGYGDVYPVTHEGRFIGGVLMFVGIALFGGMSALITSKVIRPQEQKDHDAYREELRELRADIRELRDELRRRDGNRQ